MAEAFISLLIEQLGSVPLEEIKREVRMVKGVKKDITKLESNLRSIRSVLKDAENKQFLDSSVRDWLEKLKDVSYRMDNVLDEWNTAALRSKIEKEERRNEKVVVPKKVCSFIPSACFRFNKVNQLSFHHEIGRKIKQVTKSLNMIVEEKDKFHLGSLVVSAIEEPKPIKTISLVDETEIHGRAKDKDSLLSFLLSQSCHREDRVFDVISVVGMGGLGKTTLAQLVFNDKKVKNYFDKQIWVCVSNVFDETKVAVAILESLESNTQNKVNFEALLQFICKSIDGKRFLLVLDDVWSEDEDKWEQLKLPFTHGAAGSKILVTTRKREVAIMMGATTCMINLEKLSTDNCWSIFKQRAFLDRNEEEYKQLEELGQKIARKARGLPIVAKTLGSLMRYQRTKEQWEGVLHSELWESKDVRVRKIFAPFLLSYYDLSSIAKRCFLYCSIFPKDYVLKTRKLIEMWMSQGYLGSSNQEKEGQDCLESLVMRSFFQDFNTDEYNGTIVSFKMHDIMYDFAQFLTEKEFNVMEVRDINLETKPLDEKVRHLTVVVESDAQFQGLKLSRKHEENLRTLFILQHAYSYSCLDRLNLTHLRTLNLSGRGLQRLPEDIGALLYLRYLDLSRNDDLEILPGALCDLCNLQTLRLNRCSSLRTLPQEMGKLINLRHLYINWCAALEGLPKGIARLTSLQTLDLLVIPGDKEAYFNLEDLKKLNQLKVQQFLCVKWCSNVENAGEVEKVDLKNWLRLKHLVLNYRNFETLYRLIGEQDHAIEDEPMILEAVEMPPDLKCLNIWNYLGTNFSPRLMMSLSNLRCLELYRCYNCESLPPLGNLPSLETISIWKMANLKKVGLEFFGITEKDEDHPFISFPKLKEICFHDMMQWKYWEEVEKAASNGLIIMPCLQTMRIIFCPKLEALPNFLRMTPLQSLSIEVCKMLELKYSQNRVENEWDKISHIPNIMINGKHVQRDEFLCHSERL